MPTVCGLAAPADTAPRLRLVVARIARQLRQHVDAPADLSTSLVSALATIGRVGSLTLGELAAAERVQPPSMTRIIASLERRGLVTRQVDARDRRVVRVEATTAGRKVLQSGRTRKNALLAQRMRELTPAEIEPLQAALPVLERLAGGAQ